MYSGYDEDQIGALDCEEIEGYIPNDSDILLQYAEEFEKSRQREHLDKDDGVAEKIKERLATKGDDESEEEYDFVPVQQKPKWDCETILSTYSNKYNHPKLIPEPPKVSEIFSLFHIILLYKFYVLNLLVIVC